MEQIIQDIILKLYSASEEECEKLKEDLISLAKQYGKANVVSFLETKKRSELLTVQWEIDEVLEVLNPPKKVNFCAPFRTIFSLQTIKLTKLPMSLEHTVWP